MLQRTIEMEAFLLHGSKTETSNNMQYQSKGSAA